MNGNSESNIQTHLNPIHHLPRYFNRIMAMDIKKHKISISLAEHPHKGGEQIILQTIDPIPYMMLPVHVHVHAVPTEQRNMRKALFNSRKEKIKLELSAIMKEYDVAGFVVGWPLEPSGKPGAACGRVLHLLDYLAGEFSYKMVRS